MHSSNGDLTCKSKTDEQDRTDEIKCRKQGNIFKLLVLRNVIDEKRCNINIDR